MNDKVKIVNPSIYRVMKVFSHFDMGEVANVFEEYCAVTERNFYEHIPWKVGDEIAGDYEEVDTWLLENGAEKGETVLILLDH